MARAFPHVGHRRDFLRFVSLAAAASAGSGLAADERPKVTSPRATSGDVIEPNWDERLTVTVGRDHADLAGNDHRVLQAAVDYVAALGGGTVRIRPGTYRLRNALFLRAKLRLLGDGPETILLKEPSVTTKLAADSDWYDQEITLADPSGFLVGDGVCLKTKNPHNGATNILKRTLVARSGSRFKLDRPLRENFWLMGDATASSLFPILSGEEVSDVVIENLTLDGNRQHNDNLDGNYAGCIFLQDTSRITIRGVEARNYNGDGISWQICHDVTVENCHSHDHAGLGLHPGSGSQRPVIRGNRCEHNDIGLFFCWGVKFGLAEHNLLGDNRVGISIGHRDTDNLISDNVIERSGSVAILFRPERGKAFAGHRNRIERNRIVDTGPADGVAIDVQGETESIQIARNELVESREPANRTGIRIGADTRDVQLTANTIRGFATPVADLRSA